MTNVIDISDRFKKRESESAYKQTACFALPTTRLMMDLNDQIRMVDDRNAAIIATGDPESVNYVRLAPLLSVAKYLMNGIILPFGGQEIIVTDKTQQDGRIDWMVRLARCDPRQATAQPDSEKWELDFQILIYYDDKHDPIKGSYDSNAAYDFTYKAVEGSLFQPEYVLSSFRARMRELVLRNTGATGPIPDEEKAIILTILPHSNQAIYIGLTAYGMTATPKDMTKETIK